MVEQSQHTIRSSLFFSEACDVTITNNHVLNGGGICAVVTNVNITSHVSITNNTAQVLGGGVFLYQSFLYVYFDISIANNTAMFGGGIYELNSYASVTILRESNFHNLSLTNNQATLGGGLYLSSRSTIYVYASDRRQHSLNVILTSNSAEYGGAIYVRDETNPFVCEADSENEFSSGIECFFQVADQYPDTGSLRLYFDRNTATEAGPVLFGGLLDRCAITNLLIPSFTEPNLGSMFTQTNGIDYFKNVSDVANTESITSLPVKVCFCNESKKNCSIQRLPIQIQKGKVFTVSVSAFDHVGHLMNATIISELHSAAGGLGDGQQSREIGDQCTKLPLSVTSLANEETILLYADGPCGNASQSTKLIDINFTECECPIGFDNNSTEQSTCECMCSEDTAVANLIQNCTIENQSFRKVTNFWIGYENTTDSVGIILSKICPFDYCLPFDSVEINLNIPNGADVQCANNRVGKLCSSCKTQYSLSVGQTACAKCNPRWPLFTTIIVLAFLLSGVFLIALLLLLNLSVTTGTINGLIFTASILSTIHPFPENNCATIIISLLNLNAGLNVCFYKGYNSYIKIWFQLGYPMYLFLLTSGMIVARKCSLKFAKFIEKRNPIEILATVLLLTYTKLLQFVIDAFSSADIEHPNNTTEKVWLLDGTINYYEIRHIIMLIAAIFILGFLSVYTFLLLFWQWLDKLPGWKACVLVRKTRIKPLIESYHVPFNSRHRYWTGLLLLIRIIVYIVAVFTDSSVSDIKVHFAIISLLTTLLVVKSLTVRVYKMWPVDVLESVIIALTVIVAGADWLILNANYKHARYALTFTISVVLVCLIIGTIIYHIIKYVSNKKYNVCEQLKRANESLGQRFKNVVSSDSSDSNNGEDYHYSLT